MKKTAHKKVAKDSIAVIQETTDELLRLLGVEGDFEISETDEGASIVLNTKDSGIVIGYHGEILEALQLVLSLCCSKKLDRFIRIAIEVDEYRKNRTGWLENLALQAKERSLSERGEVPMPNLKSWERRIVHLFFQNDKEVMSESIGEGRDRVLVVKPR